MRNCESWRAVVLGLVGLAAGLAGCSKPHRTARYPNGALRVRYEEATTYSTCLVASVAMASNYLLGQHRFTKDRIRSDLKRTGRDETRVGDLKAYLAETKERLYLVTLTGQLNDEAPTGLGYWLEQRGYPVICVINLDPDDPAFNHAVVVIGISPNSNGGSADIIHYLDPSSAEPLHSTDEAAFEQLWARCNHAMMIVAAPPAERRNDLK